MQTIRSKGILYPLLTALVATGIASGPVGSVAKAASREQPVTIVVDLSRQRLSAYSGANAIWKSSVSSGKSGHRTPTGVFSIIQKRPRHYSNLYNGAPMPHMQRLTWSGIALHGGHVPGYPASHGCIRIPYGGARKLFSMTSISTRVIVTYGSPSPETIHHSRLWDMLPPGEPAKDKEQPGPAGTPTADGRNGKEAIDPLKLMNSALGVTPAHATASIMTGSIPAESGPPRTQAEVERRRTAQLARLDALVGQAQTRATVAKALLEANRSSLRRAAINRRSAKAALLRAERDAAKWHKQVLRLEQETEKLIRSGFGLDPTDPRFTDLADREVKLETELSNAQSEYRISESAAGEFESALTAIEARLKELQDRHDRSRTAALTAVKELDSLTGERADLANAIKYQEAPVHILISRETSKIYARQGFNDVLEAPVTFRDADEPVGTHVFSVVDVASDEQSLSWTATSVPDGKVRAPSASEALARVVIPDGVNQRIREMIKVGSSLIVSDRKPSHETGKGTDFIVLTR